MADGVPVYNADEPAHPQENDWDCSVESTEWGLYSWGRAPADDWLEESMIAAGVVDPSVGLCDASGGPLAAWINTEYGEYGYVASNVNPVSFDALAAEAATLSHPIMAGGRAWGHWSGVRGYDAASDLLLLANPANGWMGVYQTMGRGQFASLGSFSMVRLTHPVAEGLIEPPDVDPPDPDPPPLDYSPWYGAIGTGLLDMMAADGVLPAQSRSTWLPLGQAAADVEEVLGQDGTVYRWTVSTTNQGFRYRSQ